MKWFDPVKRWKVKLEDGSAMMVKEDDVRIDTAQILPGGYKVGDLILSRVSHAFKSGGRLREGDEGVVTAPAVNATGGDNDLRLCVAFTMGKVIMLATSIQ